MMRVTVVHVIPSLDRLVDFLEGAEQAEVDRLTTKARGINTDLTKDNAALEDAARQTT